MLGQLLLELFFCLFRGGMNIYCSHYCHRRYNPLLVISDHGWYDTKTTQRGHLLIHRIDILCTRRLTRRQGRGQSSSQTHLLPLLYIPCTSGHDPQYVSKQNWWGNDMGNEDKLIEKYRKTLIKLTTFLINDRIFLIICWSLDSSCF